MTHPDLSPSDMIAVHETRDEVQKLPATTSIEDRLRTAMRFARHHWLIGGHNEGRQMLVACAAVCLVYGLDSPEGQRIATEHKALSIFGRTLELAQMGVPMDLEAATSALPKDPIGLMKLWHETTGGPHAF